MNRIGFLKCLIAPAAVAVVGPATKMLDPDGEPIREYDGQVVINGDGVMIQNATFVTPPGAKSAINVGAGTNNTAITGVHVQMGERA